MAYDEELAARIRELIAGEDGVVEKKMFGGLAFLIGGNMSVSASGQGGMLLRVDPAESEALLDEPHAQPFVMRGRAMDGWLRVDPAGLEDRARSEAVGDARRRLRSLAAVEVAEPQRGAGLPHAERHPPG